LQELLFKKTWTTSSEPTFSCPPPPVTQSSLTLSRAKKKY